MTFNKIPNQVHEILDKFKKEGFEIAVVGGAVRNLILDQDATDWDFATNATPEEILAIYDGFYDNDFGTVRIRVEKNEYEVTTYRSEFGYSDSRRPDKVVWGKSLEEDLSRRDFTINAMALVSGEEKGQMDLIDPFGGGDDINTKTIKAVGIAKDRFNEDGLRIMRAIRLAIQLNFTIEPQTFLALTQLNEVLRRIANERIRDEFLKICKCCDSYEHFMLIYDSGVMNIILPELAACVGVEQKSPKRHHEFDVWKHNVMSMITCPSNEAIVKFAALIHDIGKPLVADITEEGVRTFYNHDIVGAQIARQIALRWNMSKIDSTRITKLVRWHLFSINEFQTDKSIRRFIRNVGEENVNDLMDVRTGDRLGSGSTRESWRLKKFRERIEEVSKTYFEIKDLKIDGHDVMKIFNLKPGPEIRKVLDNVFEKVDSDELKNEKIVLLKYLEQLRSTNFLEKN